MDNSSDLFSPSREGFYLQSTHCPEAQELQVFFSEFLWLRSLDMAWAWDSSVWSCVGVPSRHPTGGFLHQGMLASQFPGWSREDLVPYSLLG